MWGSAREHHAHEAQAVIAEAEALLTGRLADYYGAERDAAPAWVVVNCVAHSGFDFLLYAAEDGPARQSGWGGALSFLAHDLVTSATSRDAVAQIQRNAFVPLELDLLSGRTPMPATPRELVELVQAFSRRRQHQSRLP